MEEGIRFESKFLSKFRILETNMATDTGAFGSMFKVKLKSTQEDHIIDPNEILAEANPNLDFVSKTLSVVKVIRCSSQAKVPKALQEAEILSTLSHDHIIKILDFWVETPPPNFSYSEDGIHDVLSPEDSSMRTEQRFLLFLQMEYADRKSLRYWLKSTWRNYKDGIKIIFQIACGLQYLHDNNIIHRDLKPENVVLCTQLKGFCTIVKVCDFGLAVNIGLDETSRRTSRVGTNGYIAPEVEGGKYTEKMDIYSLGVIFFEMEAATCSAGMGEEGPSLLRQFSKYVAENYPLDGTRLREAFPSLIRKPESLFGSKLTAIRPENRFSAAQVRLTLFEMFGWDINSQIQFYDYTPHEITILGKHDYHLTIDTFAMFLKKTNPIFVTRAIFRYLKINPGSIVHFVKPFINLIELEIVVENRIANDVVFLEDPRRDVRSLDLDSPELNPHPLLRKFVFHQLIYVDSLANYFLLDEFQLKNIMFFVPFPAQYRQLWKNRMQLDVKCGDDLIVNVDHDKEYFQISGPATRDLLLILAHVSSFRTVSITRLNPKRLPHENGHILKWLEVQGLEISLGFPTAQITKLILHDTTVNLFNDGGIFKKFEYLNELSYQGETFQMSVGKWRKFDLSRLPRSLKKVHIGSVELCPLEEDNPDSRYSLKYLGFNLCRYPENFKSVFPNLFDVQHFVTTENQRDPKNRPDLDFLITLLEKPTWTKIVLSELNWDLPQMSENRTFFNETMIPLFKKSKVPIGFEDVEFNRNELGGISVKQLSLTERLNLKEIVDDKLPQWDRTDESIVTQGLSFYIPASAIPKSDPVNEVTTIDGPDLAKIPAMSFYFDGDALNQFRRRCDHQHFPPTDHFKHKRYQVIEVKNATLGNLSQQLMGCKFLVSLILTNVRWTSSTSVKIDLPNLRVFNFFENVFGSEIPVNLSLEKLNAILFFSKPGYQGLWKRPIEIVISRQSRNNMILSHKSGEVILQRLTNVDTILKELELDENVTSLALNDCDDDVQLSSIPCNLHTLNIRNITGINFTDLVLSQDALFPNLTNLYFEAHRDNLQLLDLAVLSGRNYCNLLLGGMSITKLAPIYCKNLTMINCIYSPEFLDTYPNFLHVEKKLLFIGGATRCPTFQEVFPLLLKNAFNWVGFSLFSVNTEYTWEYCHEKRVKVLRDYTEEEQDFSNFILNWLKEREPVWEDGGKFGRANLDFLLQRETITDDWKCTLNHKLATTTQQDVEAAVQLDTKFEPFSIISGRYKLVL